MRIDATLLEAFRLYRQPDQEWMTEADLKAQAYRTSAPNRPILIGRAFETILLCPEMCRVSGGYVCDGYQFDGREIDPILETIDYRGVFQVKQVKAYGPHEVASVADQLLGNRLVEWKTTCGSSIDLEYYLDSYQWRFMADVFQPQQVKYRIWRLKDHGNTVIEVKDEQRVVTAPYPDLHRDCARLVDDFAAFASVKGWDEELNRRQRKASYV